MRKTKLVLVTLLAFVAVIGLGFAAWVFGDLEAEKGVTVGMASITENGKFTFSEGSVNLQLDKSGDNDDIAGISNEFTLSHDQGDFANGTYNIEAVWNTLFSKRDDITLKLQVKDGADFFDFDGEKYIDSTSTTIKYNGASTTFRIVAVWVNEPTTLEAVRALETAVDNDVTSPDTHIIVKAEYTRA